MIKIATTELARALKKIGNANGKGNLLLIEAAEGRIALTCYDGEAIQMQQILKSTVSEEMAGKKYVVSYSKFNEIVNVWKADNVTLKENGGLLSLEDGKTVVSVQFTTEMPEISLTGLTPGTPAVFSSESLSLGIKGLMPIVQASKNFPGIFFEPTEAPAQDPVAKPQESEPHKGAFAPAHDSTKESNQEEHAACTVTRVWGTDGNRVSFFSTEGALSGPVFLPQKAMKALLVMTGKLTFVKMGDKFLLVKDEENTMTVFSLLDKMFPVEQLKKILATAMTESFATAEMPAVDFVSVLDLMGAITNDKAKRVCFSFQKGQSISLSISDKSGKGTTELIGQYNCNEDNFCPVFAGEYLRMMLAGCGDTNIKLSFSKTMVLRMNGDTPDYVVCGCK